MNMYHGCFNCNIIHSEKRDRYNLCQTAAWYKNGCEYWEEPTLWWKLKNTIKEIYKQVKGAK